MTHLPLLRHIHWNGNVFILMKFSSLAALKVVKMTTFSAASDENFVKMTTFSFQCRHQWTGSALVQVMTCHLFSTKPLLDPMLTFLNWALKNITSVKFESKYKNFHQWKCIWKYHLRNWGHFVQREMSWVYFSVLCFTLHWLVRGIPTRAKFTVKNSKCWTIRIFEYWYPGYFYSNTRQWHKIITCFCLSTVPHTNGTPRPKTNVQ